MTIRTYSVYIVASPSGVLYVGMTNDLPRRVTEHKQKLVLGFTAKYNCHRLMYYENFGAPADAIAREKQIKGWLRQRKLALIETMNPVFADLAAGWFDPEAIRKALSSR